MTAIPRRLALLGLGLSACAGPAVPEGPGPQGAEGWEMREQIWRIPVPARRGTAESVLLEATLFRPPGPGPFPLVVMNHGQPAGQGNRAQMLRPRYLALSRLCTGAGFAVLLPLRRGFGASGGEFLGLTGGCDRMDLLNNADTAANDIAAALAWAMANMPFLDPARVVLAGQSAGGFGALSAAGRGLPGVRAVLNFSGGLRAGAGGAEGFCPGWQDALVRAMGVLGQRAAPRRVPSLWLYTSNDSYFGYGLAARMVAAWREAGAPAEYLEFATATRDGHGFVEQDGTESLWRGAVLRVLREA